MALAETNRKQKVRRHRCHPGRRPAFEPLEGRVTPATLVVTTTADSGPGSLRAAITQADADTTPDTITFDPAARGTITLLSALPDLTGNITITGPGASALTVARSAAPETPDFRIFTVTSGATVSIGGLTIANGVPLVSDNNGGGIMNDGTLTVTDSTISGNSGGLQGGGIENRGTATITNSTISGNSGGADGGGGIENRGTATITNSTISGNSAISVGGGISNRGMLTVTDSTINGNMSSSGGGVFISLGSRMAVANSMLSGNSALAEGGGIANEGTLNAINTSLSANKAYDGGGIYISAFGTATITDSTLSGNSAGLQGGGIEIEFGTVTVTNSTLSGNSADIEGGGIENGGTATINDSTISGNSASSAGGVSNGRTLAVVGSIFSNTAGGNIVDEGSGVVNSMGHNLFTDSPAIALQPTDLTDTDPLLGPLADNGGPTQTMALLPGSPAIDAGVAVQGFTTDQRGIPRPQGVAPDIGAFESRGFALEAVQGSGQSAQVGAAFATPLVVSVTSPFGEPVVGGRVTFVTPTAGPSATISTASATIGPDGQASATATAAGQAGTYTVNATTAGAAPVALTLTNQALTPPVGPPPTVVGLHRLGFHRRPTTLVITFSAAMDPARATNLANYHLNRVVHPHGPRGGHLGRPIRLAAASYDPQAHAVDLFPAPRLPLRFTYRLTVVGTPPGGLTDTAGTFLAGSGPNQAGTDYVATFGRSALVLPPRTAAAAAHRPHAKAASK
jgi:hypothetical protein